MDIQEYLAKQRQTLPERRRKALYWIAGVHFLGTIIYCGFGLVWGVTSFVVLAFPVSLILYLDLPGEKIYWVVPVLITASLLWGWAASRLFIRS